MDEHRVRSQSWVVTTSSAEDAFAWRTFLHGEGEGLLSPLLEEVFKECGVGERELHVDSLRVQVTVDSPGQLAEVLPTAIRREILQKLHLTGQGGTLQPDADAAREPEKGGFDRLLGYLERGTLPWEWQHLPVQEAAGRLTEASILHFEYIVAHLQQVREEAPFWSRLLQLLSVPLRRELFHRVSGSPQGVEQLWSDSGAMRAGEGEGAQGADGRPGRDGHPGGDGPPWARQGEAPCLEDLSSTVGSTTPETAPNGEGSAAPRPGKKAAEKGQAMHGGGAMAARGAEPVEDARSTYTPLHSGQVENVPPGQQQEVLLRRAYSAALFPGEAQTRAEKRATEGSMPQRQKTRGQESAFGHGAPQETGTRPAKSSHRMMAPGEEPSAHGAADSSREREACPADPTGVAEVTKGQASGEVALQKARKTSGKGRKQLVGEGGMVVAAGTFSQSTESEIPPEGFADLIGTKLQASLPLADSIDGAEAADYHHSGQGVEERQVGLRQVPGDPSAAQRGKMEGHGQAIPSPAAMAPGPPATAESRQSKAQTYPLLVHQGGLILLHPFMVRFLGHCGVLDAEGKKVAQGCAERAAVLLHHLCTGRDELFEFELGLEKVLLGLTPDAPLPDCRGLLGEEDRLEAENLLQSAIGHWSALKNTSVEGFRSSFLQRPALLREEGECWKLQVERKAYDLLLDHLPWSISIVRLPWMTKPLHTEW